MSTYSQAWHDTDPAIRDFYVNFALMNTAQCWHAHWIEQWHYWEAFRDFIFDHGWIGHVGFNVFQRNLSAQLFRTGQFNKDIPIIEIASFSWTDLPEPAFDPPGNFSYGSQFESIPAYSWNYPREKYRVRRSWWTGAPRYRRNL